MVDAFNPEKAHAAQAQQPPHVFVDLPPHILIEHSVRSGEGHLARGGELVVKTDKTGRSPEDKYIVDNEGATNIDWRTSENPSPNKPMSPDVADAIHDEVTAYLGERPVYQMNLYAGGSENLEHAIRVQVNTESPYAALFASYLFKSPTADERDVLQSRPQYDLLHAPRLPLNPGEYDIRSETAIAIDFAEQRLMIAGSRYAGEIKKGVFTVLQRLLPARNVATMHCGANQGKNGESALFFGLSGTGKTTLSTDSERPLIGDDEHGWDDYGIFNFEGGFYPKTQDLSQRAEPEIYAAVHGFGGLHENVEIDEEGNLVFNSGVENKRAAAPLSRLSNIAPSGRGRHPSNIIFLTADASGVVSPLSLLEENEAVDDFLSGYTSKLAGTERGVTTPQRTFSAGFGAPFLPNHPAEYAKLLIDRIRANSTKVWRLNTGWPKGYGKGDRMQLGYSRSMVNAIVNGAFEGQPFDRDHLGSLVPRYVPDVNPEVLNAINNWDDKDAFREEAMKYAYDRRQNFKRFEPYVSDSVIFAGPRYQEVVD